MVAPVNDPPECTLYSDDVFEPNANGRFEVEAGEPVTGSLYCEDPEGENLTFTVETQPQNGTLSPLQETQGEGYEQITATYTSQAAYRGPEDIVFKVSDGTSAPTFAFRLEVVAPVDNAPTCGAGLSALR